MLFNVTGQVNGGVMTLTETRIDQGRVTKLTDTGPAAHTDPMQDPRCKSDIEREMILDGTR